MVGIRMENGRRVIERWDRVFKAVSAEPRRQLLVSLMNVGPTDTVMLPESAMNPNVPTDPDALRTELHHIHLPKLAEENFIEWEADPLRASHGQRFEEVVVVFDALHSAASEIPDSLVIGCQRLEEERQNIH